MPISTVGKGRALWGVEKSPVGPNQTFTKKEMYFEISPLRFGRDGHTAFLSQHKHPMSISTVGKGPGIVGSGEISGRAGPNFYKKNVF